MALKVDFAAVDNKIDIKVDNEETTFKFEQMCCLNTLNISTVGKLHKKWQINRKNVDL